MKIKDGAAVGRLNKSADLIKADKRILISQTPDSIASGKQISCNLSWLARHFDGVM